MTQAFWILACLAIILASFFQNHVFTWSVCIGLVVIAFFVTGKNVGPTSETIMDKITSPVTLRRIKKLRKKYDEVMHQYLTIKTLSESQSSQNGILDAQLTRMQDMMRFMMESFHEISKGQADAFIDKVKEGNIDNRGVRPYINECLGIKEARRRKRGLKEAPQRGSRIIELD